jgi:alpha-methylacyl-CoA racemase
LTVGPLQGLRVLDLTRLVPGGFATLMLADLGADVVKIEEPDRGDYMRWMPPMAGEHSAGHAAFNRNKRSMTLNLKTDRGREVLLGLVTHADVLVESFRPGVLDRLGVGWDACRRSNPALVYCAITGFGQTGRRSQQAGHDINYIGYGGTLAVTGAVDGPPIIPGVLIGDLAGGGMNAVIAILAALHRRAETGAGDFCDVAMLDGVASLMTLHVAHHIATGAQIERGHVPLAGMWPCYRVYPASDGYVTVGALEPQFWSALCRAIGRDDLVDDAFAAGARGDRVVTELSELFATKSRAEWMSFFDGLDVCVGPVNEVHESLGDEDLRSRGVFVDGDLAGAGRWTHVATAINLAGAPKDSTRLPPPALGEHTEELLSEAGFARTEIVALRDAGVV